MEKHVPVKHLSRWAWFAHVLYDLTKLTDKENSSTHHVSLYLQLSSSLKTFPLTWKLRLYMQRLDAFYSTIGPL